MYEKVKCYILTFNYLIWKIKFMTISIHTMNVVYLHL